LVCNLTLLKCYCCKGNKQSTDEAKLEAAQAEETEAAQD